MKRIKKFFFESGIWNWKKKKNFEWYNFSFKKKKKKRFYFLGMGASVLGVCVYVCVLLCSFICFQSRVMSWRMLQPADMLCLRDLSIKAHFPEIQFWDKKTLAVPDKSKLKAQCGGLYELMHPVLIMFVFPSSRDPCDGLQTDVREMDDWRGGGGGMIKERSRGHRGGIIWRHPLPKLRWVDP